ncbi:helix-turn-helix domain-containing protein [Streptomyces sp. NPDC051211]|uniref:transcriptional regulator n=1 Tax=Streptomyces sp. NPDC051211 TaxID=3154643 RepID=UPI00344C961D
MDETAMFARLMRELKERSGLSYGTLARKLHTSTSTLHRYCNGEAVPTEFAAVDRFARACGASPGEAVDLHRAWLLADARRRAAARAERVPLGRGTAAAPGRPVHGTPGPADEPGPGPGAQPGPRRPAPDAGQGPLPAEGQAEATRPERASEPAAGAAPAPEHAPQVQRGTEPQYGAAAGVAPGAERSTPADGPGGVVDGRGRASAGGPATPDEEADQSADAAPEAGVDRVPVTGGGPADGPQAVPAAEAERRPPDAVVVPEGQVAAVPAGGPQAVPAAGVERRPPEAVVVVPEGRGGAGPDGGASGEPGAVAAPAPAVGLADGAEAVPAAGAERRPPEGVVVVPEGRGGAGPDGGVTGEPGAVAAVPAGGPNGHGRGRWYRGRRAVAGAAVGVAAVALAATGLAMAGSSGAGGADGAAGARSGTSAPSAGAGAGAGGQQPTGTSSGPGRGADGTLSPSPSPSPSRSSGPSPSSSPSGSVSGGTGSGPAPGSNASAPPAGTASLRTAVRSHVWTNGCDHAYLLRQQPQAVPPPPVEADAPAWAAARQAVHAGQQIVEVTVHGTGQGAVVLQDLEVRVTARRTPPPWNVYLMSQGCGGSLTPAGFAVNLDAPRPLARPVTGHDGERPLPAPVFPLRVTADDPVVLRIEASTTGCDCDWYAELRWTGPAGSGVTRIDDNGRALRTSAAAGRPQYGYASELGRWSSG